MNTTSSCAPTPASRSISNWPIPVWHIHGGHPPASHMVVPFSMLLNLASVASGAKDKAGLWGFIRRYAPEASPETHPDLDAAAGFALRYFTDFVAPTRQFRLPTEQERAAMQDLATRLKAWDGGLDAEALQSLVFAVGKDHGFENLRDWFKALYEVLLGASEGPRFGGFIALYGVEETLALIDAALGGSFASSS
jgi:lysyl-tRNA synthetase, class I